MPVTFQVVGNLADFGNSPRAGVEIRASATPGIKVSETSIHSNEPETVVTDTDGSFVLTLVSLPGVWYRISGRTYGRDSINPVNLAGYVPDETDPTTGVPFSSGTVINLRNVMSENPTPGYQAIAYVGGGGGGVEEVQGVVSLDDSGPAIREMYAVTAVTVNGVTFEAGTAMVWRRLAGAWTYKVVDGWLSPGGEPPTDPIEVTAEPVVFTDGTGTDDDTFTIPSVPGVLYRLGLEAADAGTYYGIGSVVITAEAVEGYFLSSGSGTQWEWTFSTDSDQEWVTWAADDFATAPDGPLTARVTPTGGKAWEAGYAWGAGADPVTITSQKAVPTEYSSRSRLAGIPDKPRRVFVDYNLVNSGDSTPAALSVTLGGQLSLVASSGVGTVTSALIQSAQFVPGGGHPAVDLEGETTNLPPQGRLGIEINGYTVAVTIDGETVATGTSTVNLQQQQGGNFDFGAPENRGRTSSLDNLLLEVYQ